jgi:ATP-binding cassette subfamily B protein
MEPTKRELLKDLWLFQSKRRKIQFFALLGLMILATMLEVVSLSAVIPFLGILTDPETVYSLSAMKPLIDYANIKDPSGLILPITSTFIIVVMITAAVRLLLLYISIKFSFAVGADLSVNIYRRTLYQDYSIHVSRNSSEVINGIIRKTSTVSNGVVTPLLTVTTALSLVIGITTALIFISIEVALISFFGFGLIYSLIILYSKKRLHNNGECIAKESNKVVQSLQEGLGGIRDVLLDNNQEFYCKLYRNSDIPLRNAAGNNQFVSNSPRFLMEAAGMSLIAILAYFMIQEGGAVGVLPVLGALALGAQRLLPALQQSYASYTTFIGSIPEFRDAMILLKQPLPKLNEINIEPLLFKNMITLNNVSFRHSEDLPYVLKNINLNFKKGSCTGFIGVTGSGKTTLLDIIMMLHKPSSGNLEVDSEIIDANNKRSWQANISHVPQSVYLSDSTIEENIAFGIESNLIDKDKVKKAAAQAEISDMIEKLDDGYLTMVGEGGLMLSGGQRQRIGIARALYKQSSVLIFDEATSALDSMTEKKIMNTISNLDKNLTIFIIAHRITTLKDCDQIIDLSNLGNAVVRKYNEIDH